MRWSRKRSRSNSRVARASSPCWVRTRRGTAAPEDQTQLARAGCPYHTGAACLHNQIFYAAWMIKRLSLAFVALVLLTSCSRNAPSTQVSNDSGSVGGPGEMLRDKDSAAGYGAESYRLISQPDE